MTFKISNFRSLKPVKYTITAALLSTGLGAYITLEQIRGAPKRPAAFDEYYSLTEGREYAIFSMKYLEEMRKKRISIDKFVDNYAYKLDSLQKSPEFAKYEEDCKKTEEKTKGLGGLLMGLGLLTGVVSLLEVGLNKL